ncbi:hypothetical protein T439DRAFT_378449 [Meredithblackwellia eburnea MCA 4105]
MTSSTTTTTFLAPTATYRPSLSITQSQFFSFATPAITVPFPSAYAQTQLPFVYPSSATFPATRTPTTIGGIPATNGISITDSIGGSGTNYGQSGTANGAKSGWPTWATAVIAALGGAALLILLVATICFVKLRRRNKARRTRGVPGGGVYTKGVGLNAAEKRRKSAIPIHPSTSSSSASRSGGARSTGGVIEKHPEVKRSQSQFNNNNNNNRSSSTKLHRGSKSVVRVSKLGLSGIPPPAVAPSQQQQQQQQHSSRTYPPQPQPQHLSQPPAAHLPVEAGGGPTSRRSYQNLTTPSHDDRPPSHHSRSLSPSPSPIRGGATTTNTSSLSGYETPDEQEDAEGDDLVPPNARYATTTGGGGGDSYSEFGSPARLWTPGTPSNSEGGRTPTTRRSLEQRRAFEEPPPPMPEVDWERDRQWEERRSGSRGREWSNGSGVGVGAGAGMGERRSHEYLRAQALFQQQQQQLQEQQQRPTWMPHQAPPQYGQQPGGPGSGQGVGLRHSPLERDLRRYVPPPGAHSGRLQGGESPSRMGTGRTEAGAQGYLDYGEMMGRRRE